MAPVKTVQSKDPRYVLTYDGLADKKVTGQQLRKLA
jgi:hypothetical protein